MSRLTRDLAGRGWLLKERLLSSVWTTPGTRFLIFHHVRAHEEPSFARLIDYLLDRHELAGPEEVSRNDLTTVRYILSFDDGYESNHGLVRRMLRQRNVRALFFVCPGLVGQTDPLPFIDRYLFPGIYVPEEVKRELHFMSWDQVMDLAGDGHTIGSHSMLHRRLNELDDDRALHEEIVTSGERLADRLKHSVNWFAYPFGDLESINGTALELIDRHYEYCCSGIRGLNPAGERRHDLFREYVDLSAPFPFQLMSAGGGLDFVYARQRRAFDRMLPRRAFSGFR